MTGIVTKAQKEDKDTVCGSNLTIDPGMSSSPAQRLVSRHTRSMLPSIIVQ